MCVIESSADWVCWFQRREVLYLEGLRDSLEPSRPEPRWPGNRQRAWTGAYRRCSAGESGESPRCGLRQRLSTEPISTRYEKRPRWACAVCGVLGGL